MDAGGTKWRPTGSGNEVLTDGRDFFISYNPNTRTGHALATDMLNIIAPLAGLNEVFRDGPETALVVKSPSGKSSRNKFYILEGDFRKDYEKAFPKGLDACMKVYDKYKAKNNSSWSTE